MTPEPEQYILDFPPIEFSELPSSEGILKASQTANTLHLLRTVATLCRRLEALERQVWGLEEKC